MFRAVVVLLTLLLLGLFAFAILSRPNSSESHEQQESQGESLQGGSSVGSNYQRRLDDAIKAFRDDDDAEAMEEIRRLSAQSPPFLPAHRFMVEHLIQVNREQRDLSVLPQLVHNLKIVAESGDQEAKLILGRLYAVTGQREKAIDLLGDVVATHPEVGVMLSGMLTAEGKKSEAELVAKEVVATCRQRLEIDEEDVKARLVLADNLGTLQQYEEAVEVIRQGIDQHPELSDLLVEFLIKQADAAMEGSPLKSLTLLKKASREEPSNPVAWRRLVELMSSDHATAANAAKQYLADASKANDESGALSFVMGSHAYANGQYKVAIETLQKANRRSPENPSVANALALSLAKSDPPQITRALELSEEVIEMYPTRKDFLAVRGEIRLLAGEELAAIEDFETSLQELPNNLAVIEHLVSLYETHAMMTKARAMRTKLASLKNQAAFISKPLRDVLKDQRRELQLKD